VLSRTRLDQEEEQWHSLASECLLPLPHFGAIYLATERRSSPDRVPEALVWPSAAVSGVKF